MLAEAGARKAEWRRAGWGHGDTALRLQNWLSQKVNRQRILHFDMEQGSQKAEIDIRVDPIQMPMEFGSEVIEAAILIRVAIGKVGKSSDQPVLVGQKPFERVCVKQGALHDIQQSRHTQLAKWMGPILVDSLQQRQPLAKRAQA